MTDSPIVPAFLANDVLFAMVALLTYAGLALYVAYLDIRDRRKQQ